MRVAALPGTLNRQSPAGAQKVVALVVRTVLVIVSTTAALPEDISLLAFDDHAVASHLVTPLSVIRRPLQEMGQLAAEALQALCKSDHPLIQLVRLAELVIRASCAPPR